MKKKFVVLFMIAAMMISGCQANKQEPEPTTPATPNASMQETLEVPTEESMSTEETIVESTDTIPTELPSEAPDDAVTNDALTVYAERMNLIYQALNEQWSVDKYFDNDMSHLMANHYEGDALASVGYALVDLDGDGKDELIISAVDKDYAGGMLYDVYSAPNDEVLHVLCGHERNRFYLQDLEDEGYGIANEASDSAWRSAWYYYSLVEGKLELTQGIIVNVEADAESPWFFTYDEDWDVSNDTHDMDGMAESIIETYRQSYMTLEYIPFSTYNVN
jgi:hypothetical protein